MQLRLDTTASYEQSYLSVSDKVDPTLKIVLWSCLVILA